MKLLVHRAASLYTLLERFGEADAFFLGRKIKLLQSWTYLASFCSVLIFFHRKVLTTQNLFHV